jgi:hypothetical protein
VSGVVNAILGHCAVDEERGGTQVFTVQRDRWRRCDAAAEHMVAKLRSIGSGLPVQNQSTRGRSANTRVQRTLGTPSSLDAGKGDTSLRDGHAEYRAWVSSIDGHSTPLLQPHLSIEQSGTDSTYMSSSGGWAPPTSMTGSNRESSSHTSMTGNSMASCGARSAYHSAADTTSMRSFKTANEGSTASLNGGEGGGGRSGFDSASACSMQLPDSRGGDGSE